MDRRLIAGIALAVAFAWPVAAHATQPLPGFTSSSEAEARNATATLILVAGVPWRITRCWPSGMVELAGCYVLTLDGHRTYTALLERHDRVLAWWAGAFGPSDVLDYSATTPRPQIKQLTSIRRMRSN